MLEELQELSANLPAYLGGHMLLSVTAVAAAVAISLPLGIIASRRPKLGESLLGVAGVVQTVPSLALLGLLVFLLGRIGFRPAFLALVLYGVLPILANTIIGIRGVDPILIEAAQGLGMSDRQRLWRVELPLAAPVILGGLRTATVLVVGTATLATSVGALSLGNYIFAGLGMLNYTATAFGCVAAAVLAVLLDQLVRLLEVAARTRDRRRALLGAAGLLLVTVGGLYEPVTRWLAGRDRQAVIANNTFTEQYILAHAMGRRLEAAGFHRDHRDGIAYGIQLNALKENRVDCLVAYTGDIWTRLMKRSEFDSREKTRKQVYDFLHHEFGVVCVGALGFEDAYALAMAPSLAQKWGVRSITDLARFTRERLGRRLKIGGDTTFFELPEWRELKKRYGLKTGDVKIFPMEQTLMYRAMVEDQLDVIAAYTSDGRIKAYKLQLLKDDKEVFPPYDAILLVSPEAARRPGFVDSLKPLIGAIDLETMQEANRRVDEDHESPRLVAAWLLERVEAHHRKQSAAKGVMP
jgi:osmoprotectant transport system permease protein